MIQIENPYIVYSLPNNKVDQSLKNNKLDICWNDIEYFLSNVTNAEIFQPRKIGLNLFIENTATSEKRFSYYQEMMNNSDCFNLFENSTKNIQKDEYLLNNNVLILAKDFFAKNQQKIKLNADISLEIDYCFYLKDQKKGTELGNQQLRSSITLYISKDIKCNPTLFFPFEKDSEEFWSYFESLKPFLPFELDEKYLKLSRIKNGKITSFKKIKREG
ncbi:hypothetical protein AB9T88_15190 [Flavobacterium sp. LBUM151]